MLRPKPIPGLAVPLAALLALAALRPALAAETVEAAPGGPVHAPSVQPTPLPGPGQRPMLGIEAVTTRAGLRIARVHGDSPAQRAGLRPGDLLLAAAGRELRGTGAMAELTAGLVPGEPVHLTLRRDGADVVVPVVAAARAARKLPGSGPRFRIAVVPVRFAGEEPAKDRGRELRQLLFERSGRLGAGASAADYFADQSHGALSLGGEVLAPVRLEHAREHYAGMMMGGRRGTLFDEAGRGLLAREGAELLLRFDAFAFVYSGPAETRPGLALWPHRSSIVLAGNQVSYYVHPTGEDDTVGVHCHEVGHLLGLPDEYGVGHRTGSGDFCLMALGHRGGGGSGARSPFSLCAHCRFLLGWLDPEVVDPRTPRQVVLEPVALGADRALVLPLDARCSEYLLLEVRTRRGFDRELPSEGLLVWHVGGPGTPGQGPYRMPVDLIEAHGIDTFDAALVRTHEIAFPTARATDLSTRTEPALRVRAGAFRVRLTGIRREAGGAVAFTLCSRSPVVQEPPLPYVPTVPERDGAVVRDDPITGLPVRFYPRRPALPGAAVGRAESAGSER